MNTYDNSTREQIIERCEYWKNEFMVLSLKFIDLKKEKNKYKRLYDDERIKRLELLDKLEYLRNKENCLFYE